MCNMINAIKGMLGLIRHVKQQRKDLENMYTPLEYAFQLLILFTVGFQPLSQTYTLGTCMIFLCYVLSFEGCLYSL